MPGLPTCRETDSLPASAIHPHSKTNPEDFPMIRSRTILGALALAATTGTVFAQGAPPPPARGLEMALAVEAAQEAVNTCLGQGVKGAAAILDSAGVLRVLIS